MTNSKCLPVIVIEIINLINYILRLNINIVFGLIIILLLNSFLYDGYIVYILKDSFFKGLYSILILVITNILYYSLF
jgi:hypothetical protein